jgi:hypothetical protein
MSSITWREVGWIVRGRGRAYISDFVRRRHGGSHHPAYRLLNRLWIDSMPIIWMADAYEHKYDPARFNDRWWHRDHPAPDSYWEPKNGRPRNEVARAAATIARYLYLAWRENKEREITDYGHRHEMKDFAAQAVVEDIFALHFSEPKLSYRLGCKSPDEFVEVVRDLMEKPRARRDLEDWVDFEFLATPDGLHLPPKPPKPSLKL